LFQFPHLFPKFIAKEPVDMTEEETKPGPEAKPDVKPTIPLQARKKKEVLPEGRVGTMVVMKSGKVKLVMGDDIVMNVSLRQ
jgi:DNA-directed RNA polymerase III subunit RPC4